MKRKDADGSEIRVRQRGNSLGGVKKRKRVIRILSVFAEKCSMQGPQYIASSTWWLSRTLWVVMLVSALGAMTFHLYYLCQTYFAWPVKNIISLGFSSLQFPAVTVCNVNPVRASRQDLLSADFRKLVDLMHPQNLEGAIKTHTENIRRKRNNVSRDDKDQFIKIQLDHVDFGLQNHTFTNARGKMSDDALADLNGYGDSWENEGQESSFSGLERIFREVYAAEDRAARIAAGHQIDDMLIGCSFAGMACYPSNFTLHTSLTYGNCYTLQYDKFVSKQSGPSGGLELLLYLERDEYLRGFTPSDGIKVAVHAKYTAPFPEDDGLSVSSGTHTLVSMKLVQKDRLGKPYGLCAKDGDFMHKYKLHYTRQTCRKMCEQVVIHDNCSCRDETVEDLNIIMDVQEMKPCRSPSELKCMHRVRWTFMQGELHCECISPCLETKYDKTISARPWPTKDYADRVLITIICHRVSANVCDTLKSKNAYNLSHDFVKLNIYYEDLNYENITEQPDYEDVQFISDVGGTLGLWVGISILSIMEIAQLVAELLRYVICCRWRIPQDG